MKKDTSRPNPLYSIFFGIVVALLVLSLVYIFSVESLYEGIGDWLWKVVPAFIIGALTYSSVNKDEDAEKLSGSYTDFMSRKVKKQLQQNKKLFFGIIILPILLNFILTIVSIVPYVIKYGKYGEFLWLLGGLISAGYWLAFSMSCILISLILLNISSRRLIIIFIISLAIALIGMYDFYYTYEKIYIMRNDMPRTFDILPSEEIENILKIIEKIEIECKKLVHLSLEDRCLYGADYLKKEWNRFKQLGETS